MLMASRIAAVAVATCMVCPQAAAQTSYLVKNEDVVCVGDSITAAGLYIDFVEQILRTLYPDAGIRLHNLGQGGASAPGGANSLAAYLEKNQPTLALFMFGVNDTRWSDRQGEEKVAQFLGGLQKACASSTAKEVPLVLLRESNFSHGRHALPDAFESRLNRMLDKLLAAQDEFALENQLSVIDVLGAYRRQLEAAWAKDPAYEFTPDVIHPTAPGHAAIAVEILRAFGAGLPLSPAADKRGPIQLERSKDITLRVADCGTIMEPSGSLSLKIEAIHAGKEPLEGTLLACVAGQRFDRRITLPAGGKADVSFDLPVSRLAHRWAAVPLYVAFTGGEVFAADGTLLWYSRVQPVAPEPLALADGDFGTTASGTARVCPVSRVQVSRQPGAWHVDFAWKDATPVAAQPGFLNHFRQEITTPVDLNSRNGQPCDAIEFFFDLRDAAAIGRWTANIDSNPPGVLRLGVYREKVDGGVTAKVVSAKDSPPATVELKSTGEDTWQLIVRAEPAGPVTGFSMRVVDSEDFEAPRTAPFCLTSHHGQEPMSYIQLGAGKSGVFCRVGY
jgi:lysophospholipase L1-like esterase